MEGAGRAEPKVPVLKTLRCAIIPGGDGSAESRPRP